MADYITKRELEAIQNIIDRILAQIAEKQAELKDKQAKADEAQKRAQDARAAGDYQKAGRLEMDAIKLRDQVQTIKREIDDLDKKHEKALYRARSCRIEYR